MSKPGIRGEILSALADGPLTGYGISRAIADRRPPVRFLWKTWRNWPGYGEVYGALDALRREGLVETSIDHHADGPRYRHRLVSGETARV